MRAFRTAAYGIAREALINVVRHARARRAELRLECQEAGVRLTVQDDGIGLDPAGSVLAGKRGHWGLRGMRERADGIGATLLLQGSPGGGTSVMLLVPADAAYSARVGLDTMERLAVRGSP